MQVYVYSYAEYDSVGADFIKVFSKKADVYKYACYYLKDLMDEHMQNIYDKEEYVECFEYWKEELYSPSEKDECPVVDIQLCDVDA